MADQSASRSSKSNHNGADRRRNCSRRRHRRLPALEANRQRGCSESIISAMRRIMSGGAAPSRYDADLVGNTVSIASRRGDSIDEWRDFTRFPRFMENVRASRSLTTAFPMDDQGAARLDGRTGDQDHRGQARRGHCLEERAGSQIRTEGRVEFIELAPERGTGCGLTQRYTRPAGWPGRASRNSFSASRTSRHAATSGASSLDGNRRSRHKCSPSGRASREPDPAPYLGEYRCEH